MNVELKYFSLTDFLFAFFFLWQVLKCEKHNKCYRHHPPYVCLPFSRPPPQPGYSHGYSMMYNLHTCSGALHLLCLGNMKQYSPSFYAINFVMFIRPFERGEQREFVEQKYIKRFVSAITHCKYLKYFDSLEGPLPAVFYCYMSWLLETTKTHLVVCIFVIKSRNT